MVVSWRKDGICGLVLLNNPPVNAINREIRQGLLKPLTGLKRKGLRGSFIRRWVLLCRWC